MQSSEFKPETPEEKRMWAYMMAHPAFAYADVERAAEVTRYRLDSFVGKLRRLKLIHPAKREGRQLMFTVMDHQAAENFEAERKGKREGVIWTAMRSLKAFTQAELLLVISDKRDDITQKHLQRYCALLVKSEYLAVIQKARKDGQPARYQLVNDTGPLAPVQRNLQVVVDQNADKLVFAAGGRI